MLVTDTTVELGRLCTPNATTVGARHQLLRLRDQPMIVMPYARAQGGWECIVVASRTPRSVHHLTLTDEQVADAATTVPAQPERYPDGYARMVWMSQAFRHWPGGAMLALARYIVDGLRPPGSIYVSAAALADYNAISPRLPTTRPVAVGRLLDQLITAGFLMRVDNQTWRLTLLTDTTRS